MEQFKEINYQGADIIVSSYGRIFKNDKYIEPRINRDGYELVSLKTENGYRSARVNRLVAIAFIDNPDPENKLEVNHIDFDRRNNHVENLEWVTHAENVRHSRNAGRYPDTSGNKNPNYGNHALSQKYKQHPELAKEKQSRPGVKNGRARPTDLYLNGILVGSFPYFEKCCEYLRDKFDLKSTEFLKNRLTENLKTGNDYKGYTVVKH